MTNFESRETVIELGSEKVYNFVSKIDNFENLIPEGLISGFESDGSECSFFVEPVGVIKVGVSELVPLSKVVYESIGKAPFKFKIVFSIIGNGNDSTVMRVIAQADLNVMLKMMLKSPIQEGVEKVSQTLAAHLNSLPN